MKNVHPATVKSFSKEWSRYDQASISKNELEKVFNDYFSIFPWEDKHWNLIPKAKEILVPFFCALWELRIKKAIKFREDIWETLRIGLTVDSSFPILNQIQCYAINRIPEMLEGKTKEEKIVSDFIRKFESKKWLAEKAKVANKIEKQYGRSTRVI